MKFHTTEPDFGATGQFEQTGFLQSDRRADTSFSTTMGMDKIRTLILLGTGAFHLRLLNDLARQRRGDLDLALIAPDCHHVDANMLPGFVAGQHPLTDCTIDLSTLISGAGGRWIQASCAGLDAATSTVMLAYSGKSDKGATGAGIQRPALMTYDLLSIDTEMAASSRQLDKVLPGAGSFGVPVFPLWQFANRWEALCSQLAATGTTPDQFINVLGADTLAVELVFAVKERLSRMGLSSSVRLLTDECPLLPDLAEGARKRVLRRLVAQGIDVVATRCASVQADGITLIDGTRLSSSLTLVAKPWRSPEWLVHSSMDQDDHGRIHVNPFFQSVTHKGVFVGGDVAVAAGRAQTPVSQCKDAPGHLARNLLARLGDQPLQAAQSCQHTLRFVRCHTDHGVACWSALSAEGAWAQRMRDRTDQARLSPYRSI